MDFHIVESRNIFKQGFRPATNLALCRGELPQKVSGPIDKEVGRLTSKQSREAK